AAGPAARRGALRARDRAPHGDDSGLGARQPLPRARAAAPAAREGRIPMNEGRLYDRSGPPDPEVDRLEELLRPYGHVEGAPLRALRAAAPRRRAFPAAAAALLCLGFGGAYAFWRLSKPVDP